MPNIRKLEIGGNNLVICLDTVTLGTPKDVVEILGPFTANLRIKDFEIARVLQMMGFQGGARAGTGKLDIPWLLEQISSRVNVLAILEQWATLKETAEATVENERKWAMPGVEHLRSCGCI